MGSLATLILIALTAIIIGALWAWFEHVCETKPESRCKRVQDGMVRFMKGGMV